MQDVEEGKNPGACPTCPPPPLQDLLTPRVAVRPSAPEQLGTQLWQHRVKVCFTTPSGIELKTSVDSLIRAPVFPQALLLTPGFLFCFRKKNVLQGQHEADKIWSKEGFYAVVIFLSIFIIIVTCLMVSLLLLWIVSFVEPPA